VAALQAFLLAGDTRAAGWMLELLQQAAGRRLRPRAAGRQRGPPQAVPARSPQVCSCFDVSEAASRRRCRTAPATPISACSRAAGRLRCGTQCGSLPAAR
jgi:assimilatory nitrate reductase catalytic subunit